MGSSNEDLLERVLYAYESESEPRKSIYRFESPDGFGPVVKHGASYKLVPKPSYRRRHRSCCSFRTALCSVLLLFILTATVGLGVFYFLRKETFLARSNDLSKEMPANGTRGLLQNITNDPFVEAVRRPGAKIVIRPPDIGRIVPTFSMTMPIVHSDDAETCNNLICHPNATCSNGLCRCGLGFTGDGVKSCTHQVVASSPLKCKPGQKVTGCCCNSYCVPSSESPEIGVCECKAGYERRGGKSSDSSRHSHCVDINECRDPDLNDCPKRETRCFNVSGGYRCLCRAWNAVFDGKDCKV